MLRLVSVLTGDGDLSDLSDDEDEEANEPLVQPLSPLKPVPIEYPEHYRPDLSPGGLIRIQGLRGRTELNGQVSRVVCHDMSDDRFEVEPCDLGKETVRCKREHLFHLDSACFSDWQRASALHSAGQADPAIESYKLALSRAGAEHDPLSAGIYVGLSLAHSKTGQHPQALDAAQKVIDLRPKWSKGHALRGYNLASSGSLREAHVSYMRAVEIDPTCESSLLGLWGVSDRLVREGVVEDKEAEAERRQEQAADAMAGGQLSLAIALYTVAHATIVTGATSRRSFKQQAATCMAERSAIFAQLENWGKSLTDAEEAISLSPYWVRPQVNAGVALCNLGHAEKSYRAFLAAGDLESGYQHAVAECQRVLWQIPKLQSPLALQRQQRFGEDAHKPKGSCRVFAISDVHIDHDPSVLKWVEAISSTAYQDDILLVAGDLADTFNAIKRGLTTFRNKFRRVFYVPGNHDLWIRPDTSDSLKMGFKDSVSKLLALMDMCDSIGVEMMPAQVMEDVYIVPLLSWWSCTFDVNDPFPSETVYDAFCRWPMGEEGAHNFFLRWNEGAVRKVLDAQGMRGSSGEVITFSHFLPCTEILTPNAPSKASGCAQLEQQLVDISSSFHIFGHTHRNFQYECRGVTYQQHSLMDPNYEYSADCALLKVHDDVLCAKTRGENPKLAKAG